MLKETIFYVLIALIIILVIYKYNENKSNNSSNTTEEFEASYDNIIYDDQEQGNVRNYEIDEWYAEQKRNKNKKTKNNKNKKNNSKYSTNNNQNINNDYFNRCQFHSDYIDVLDSFKNISAGKQIFNINNFPCTTEKDIDITKVGEIVDNFINDLKENVMDTDYVTRENTLSWQSALPHQKYTDGFEKVRKHLGLPEKLYKDPILKTEIKLEEYSNIVKCETDTDVRYSVNIIISRNKSKDKLSATVKFVYDKKNPTSIIVEDININGFILYEQVGKSYEDVNKFYDFKSLDNNNMFESNDVMKELDYKLQVRNKLMQEQIDNLNPDDKYMHMSINPNEYAAYDNVQTIYEDVYGEKHFE